MDKKFLKIILSLVIIIILIMVGLILVRYFDGNEDQNLNNILSSVGDEGFIAYVIEQNGKTLIVKPAETEAEIKSSDKFSIGIGESNETFEIGDKVRVTYTGGIMETYPAQVKTIKVEKVLDEKLELMYKTVIDKLYEEDTALNYNAKYIALDLDGIEEIIKRDNIDICEFNVIPNETQKESLLNYCKKYNENVMNAGFDELKEQGLFNEEKLYIEGILIYISNIEKVSENRVHLEAVKYKSGLRAIFLECEMKYKDNNWELEIKGYAIS